MVKLREDLNFISIKKIYELIKDIILIHIISIYYGVVSIKGGVGLLKKNN